MSNINRKSIGFLIDELITTSMRCWFFQENIMNEELTEKERLAGAIGAQEQNAKRSSLIRAIDIRLGDGDITQSEKTYSYFKTGVSDIGLTLEPVGSQETDPFKSQDKKKTNAELLDEAVEKCKDIEGGKFL